MELAKTRLLSCRAFLSLPPFVVGRLPEKKQKTTPFSCRLLYLFVKLQISKLHKNYIGVVKPV
jgi:hypothetical protein